MTIPRIPTWARRWVLAAVYATAAVTLALTMPTPSPACPAPPPASWPPPREVLPDDGVWLCGDDTSLFVTHLDPHTALWWINDQPLRHVDDTPGHNPGLDQFLTAVLDCHNHDLDQIMFGPG